MLPLLALATANSVELKVDQGQDTITDRALIKFCLLCIFDSILGKQTSEKAVGIGPVILSPLSGEIA